MTEAVAKLYVETKLIGSVRQIKDIDWRDPSRFLFVMEIGVDVAAIDDHFDRRHPQPLDFRMDFLHGEKREFTALIKGLTFRSDFGSEIEVQVLSVVVAAVPA